MRNKAFTWIELVVVLAILVILAAILFPVFGPRREAPRTRSTTCQTNLKQIGLGIKQYVQDYDEKFPLVTSGKDGWMDIIQPYIKSTQLFHCPSDSTGGEQGTSDYFYNSRLAGQEERKLTFISNTIMNGDGAGDSPSNVSLSELPPSWTSDSKSPSWRHLEGANYSYADGHVKWLKADKVTNQKADIGIVTFAPW